MDKQTANEAVLSPARPFLLGEKVYACRPARLTDLGSIGIQIRKSRARGETPLGRLVNDPAWKLLPVQAQVEIAKVAAQVQVSGTAPLDEMGMVDGLAEPANLALAIWICLKDQHPELTIAEIAREINEDNAVEVYVRFDEASGMSSLGNSAGPSPSPPSGTGGP